MSHIPGHRCLSGRCSLLTPAFLCAVALILIPTNHLFYQPTPSRMPALPLGSVSAGEYTQASPIQDTQGTSSCLHTQIPPLTSSPPAFSASHYAIFTAPPCLKLPTTAWLRSPTPQTPPRVGFLGRPQQKCHELRHLKTLKPRVLGARVQSHGMSRALFCLQAERRGRMFVVLACSNISLIALHLLIK